MPNEDLFEELEFASLSLNRDFSDYVLTNEERLQKLMGVVVDLQDRVAVVQKLQGPRGNRGIVGAKGDIGPKPKAGVDYPLPVNGTDGRNPMTVSKQKPTNPKIGDLWYQPN